MGFLDKLKAKFTKKEVKTEKQEERKQETSKTPSLLEMNLDENSPGYHYLEELKDRAKKNEDDQMRLF